MLQDIRQHIKGPTAKIVVGLIVISFAFFGIESILVSGGGNEVAEVNGEPIYPQEVQQALDTQKRRLVAMMGDKLDPLLLDDDQLRPQAMESLVNRKLLMQASAAAKLAISENEIGSVVAGMEQFQVDGTFSPDAYKSALSSAGYTPAFFKQSLHDDMLLNQLRSGLAGSEFVTLLEQDLNARVIGEQRDLQFVTIPLDRFRAQSPPTEAAINDYYTAHKGDFQSQESVDIDYLELTLDEFREPVEESAILEAFELSKQDAQFKTQNRVSHILFESDDKGAVQSRLAKAQEKLASGVTFADVAKELSQDAGSADKGGDLGYSGGDTFPEAMEAAIANLQPGIVSEPVETDAGTHLILVTDRKKAEEPILSAQRDQLTEKIQTEEARKVLMKTVESLKDLAFNSEDLAYPAKELNLTVKQADRVTRSERDGLFSNPAIVKAAFSEEVMSSTNNSEVIEFTADSYYVLHVRQHHKPALKPLAEVREQVIAAATGAAARAALEAETGLLIDKLREGLSLEQYAKAQGYKFQVELAVDRRTSSVPPEVVSRVFELPPPAEGGTETDFVVAPNGDAVLMQLTRVTAGEYKVLTEAEKEQLQEILSGETGSLLNNEFQLGLRERAEISVL